jgi:hypothetical protein
MVSKLPEDGTVVLQYIVAIKDYTIVYSVYAIS